MSEDSLLASPPLTLTSQIVQTTSRALKRVHETVAEALLGGQDEKDAPAVKPQPKTKSPGLGTPGLGTLDSLAAAAEAAAAEAAAANDAGAGAGEKGETPPVRGNVFDEVA